MIPLGDPPIDDREIAAVEAVLRAGQLSTGETVEAFEDDVSTFAGREHAAAVSSGSVALELALEGLDLSPGAGVVVSPFNCGAVLYSVLRTDLVPVFAEIDEATYGLDPAGTRRAIEAADVDVDAILAVHLYGLPCAVRALERVAAEHGVALVEDFAQAPGARCAGDPTGSFGDVGVASFGATKNVTTAEGGAVVSDDAALLERVRDRRTNVGAPMADSPGSFRMNDVEAAIGREQLAKYEEVVERKRTAAGVYDDELPDAVRRPPRRDDATHVFHGYPIRTDDRDALAEHLDDRGVETAAVYDTPLFEYPRAAERTSAPVEDYPATRSLADEVLLLPIHGSISAADARTVATAVVDFFE